MKKYVLYFHINSFTEEIFYVGIGDKSRPYITRRSELWNRIVKKYGYKIKIIHEFDSRAEAEEMEVYYIHLYGRLNNKTGILANLTNGGEGCTGYIMSEETKRKIIEYKTGKKHSAETCLKKSIALKGRKPHPNTLAARKLVPYKGWNKGQKMKEETRLKMIASKTGQKLTEDHKNKISAKLKGRVFSDEHRRKNSEALKGRPKSEETKKKLSEAAKKQWQTGNTWYNKVA